MHDLVPTGDASAFPSAGIAVVLAWCNRVRADLGLPALGALRTGVPGNPWFCPVCRTVGAGMPDDLQPEFSGTTLRVWCAPRVLRLEATAPDIVARFAEDFDRGVYGGLVVDRAVAFAEGVH